MGKGKFVVTFFLLCTCANEQANNILYKKEAQYLLSQWGLLPLSGPRESSANRESRNKRNECLAAATLYIS